MSDEQKHLPKRRGRKAGVKTGPRIGSRPWLLSRMGVGDALCFEAPLRQASRLMMQIQTDIGRLGLSGAFEQRHYVAVQPTEKDVIDIVRVVRVEKEYT